MHPIPQRSTPSAYSPPYLVSGALHWSRPVTVLIGILPFVCFLTNEFFWFEASYFLWLLPCEFVSGLLSSLYILFAKLISTLAMFEVYLRDSPSFAWACNLLSSSFSFSMNLFEALKSVNLICLFFLWIRILSGLMSRWQTPFWCKYSTMARSC